ncbi:membrane hypothetical protein [Parafrankia sp. Ea1.12]|uniref:O-antigen ligase family protein n=1 Tax=Parafrankia sp. Ea1.12 TaxID=573499 RepID=UPI000DA51FD7|nr:O-antigen ligase family protein [Parafrankia sp. Ea1.12]SQD97048.1 membrane hypothetical protein [Parafrankia sp. Ea1.12]
MSNYALDLEVGYPKRIWPTSATAAVDAPAGRMPRSLISTTGLLGFFTPLYILPGVSPHYLDAARTVLLLAVLARLFLVQGLAIRSPHIGWMLLALAYLLSGTANWDRSTASFAALTVLAATAGETMANNGETFRFFGGYRLAAVLSAAATVAEAAGHAVVTTPVVQWQGVSGLSTRSTSLAFELAIAILIWFWQGPRGPRLLLWPAEGLLLIGALVMCGGRGGLVALCLSIAVYPLIAGAWRQVLVTTLILSGVGTAILVSGRTPLTLTRLMGQPERTDVAHDSYSSGRTGLAMAALDAVPDAMPFGDGFATRVAPSNGEFPRAPHNALLAVTLDAGVLGCVAAVILLVAGARGALPRRRRHAPTGFVIRTILVTLLVRSMLEGQGVLTGGAGVLVFSLLRRHTFLMAGLADRDTSRRRHHRGRARTSWPDRRPLTGWGGETR